MMRNIEKTQDGLTLIESAIAILIIGLMVAAMSALYSQSHKQATQRETRDKMQVIIKALSTYVETAGRLPCPANPADNTAAFGWEWNVTAADAAVSAGAAPSGRCDTATNSVAGIVPFQTLNLPPEAVLDGWGRYFTYAVSPEFTLDNDPSPPHFKPGWVADDAADQVHARCRDGAWLGQNDNINAVKARFCCAVMLMPSTNYYPPNTDIRIQLAANPGTDISPVRVDNSAGYNSLNTLNVGGKPVINIQTSVLRAAESTANITAPALVLVSHGENGRGAFLANGSMAQLDINNAFALERENWNGNAGADRLFYTGRRNLSNTPASYFDDIVIWMTQDGVMAANGTSSCQYP